MLHCDASKCIILYHASGNSPPLLLILGYTVGVQVWLIPANGEAQEIVAQKHGQIKTLKLLRTPDFNSAYGSPDNFAHCRPLMVTVDSTGPGSPFSSATFTSMKVILELLCSTVNLYYG